MLTCQLDVMIGRRILAEDLGTDSEPEDLRVVWVETRWRPTSTVSAAAWAVPIARGERAYLGDAVATRRTQCGPLSRPHGHPAMPEAFQFSMTRSP